MLAYSYHQPKRLKTDAPLLVFLHGLLGDGHDWQACIEHLSDWPCITLDLPGHGQSKHIVCDDFAHVCQLISDTLLTLIKDNSSIVLIGYSLGGRIAMHGIANHAFNGLYIPLAMIEGGNFGLQTKQEKQQRWQADCDWANRFKSEPIEQVLNDWYRQAVFSSLNHAQRQTFIRRRSANLGPAIGHMLQATSLAKQSYLLNELRNSSTQLHYICGEKDHKFSQMAQASGLAFSQIANAGHNVHKEQPQAFADQIKERICTHFGE
ncbi:2-succinyl-6-hydroxy-2,4-cyclohexadiene-1-carboxylate synthase [Vibrio sp. LaRot3]|uniref:2-succinyl-6-hydroxy-2, 4-cyclohexadiene-1-carboxylate synthase n=1 Tax=Vibrio sp. LaRot3 TaxID=2998829 RepID=UPI0022CDE37A|nr:2-succinyl-6-hydroxy-2,4-cyclohexadiene-1-carboxylate synthase [Vibrio sp. LaRot3]MDA0147913.1 2-succinyl-6-hydroxy-2,4-cyclohexadiene-1-carboxylate synthase [Vibrio sp. LaRot3]